MNAFATISLIAAGTIAVGLAVQAQEELPDQGRPKSNAQDAEKTKEETSEQRFDSNTIFGKFQEMKAYLTPLYGANKVTELQGMTNEEINDTWSFMFQYADLKNAGKNKKEMPVELAKRVTDIEKKYKIFT